MIRIEKLASSSSGSGMEGAPGGAGGVADGIDNQRVRIVLVGDGAVGKVCFRCLMRF